MRLAKAYLHRTIYCAPFTVNGATVQHFAHLNPKLHKAKWFYDSEMSFQ